MKKAKKIAVGLLITSMLTSITACGATGTKETTQTIDSSFTEAETVNDDGIVTTKIRERGLVFSISQDYIDKGVTVEGYNENLDGYLMASIIYYSPSANEYLDTVINMDAEERTPEVSDEYMQKIWDTSRTILDVVMIETAEYNDLMTQGTTLDKITGYAPTEELGENDGYTYIVSIPDLDYGKLNEDEIKEYEDCKNYMKTVIDTLSFMPVTLESNETVLDEYFPTFSSIDLEGNKITDDIFAEKNLTVVNIWGTFCSPCIEEMPELQKWSEELPDNVQIIGLVGDIEGEDDTEYLELAQMIQERAGVKFPNIVGNDDFSDLLYGLVGYPTTIFVDSTGAIVGEPIVGAEMDAYKTYVEEYLNENAN